MRERLSKSSSPSSYEKPYSSTSSAGLTGGGVYRFETSESCHEMCFDGEGNEEMDCRGDGGGDDLMTCSTTSSTCAWPSFNLRSLRAGPEDDFLRAVTARAYVSSMERVRSRLFADD